MSKEQKIIIGIITGFLLISLFSCFPNPKPQNIVRFAINCIFCFFLYKGKNWARWIMGALSAIACVAAIMNLRTPPPQPELISIIIAIAGFYGFSAFVLLSGKFISNHLKIINIQ